LPVWAERRSALHNPTRGARGPRGSDEAEDLLAKAAEAKHPLAIAVVNWGEVYYSVWRARGESGGGQAARDRPPSN
jgi:hypothetical protein